MRRAVLVLVLLICSLGLLHASMVTGKVVGPDGKPVAGVLLLVDMRNAQKIQEIQPDADGGFSLDIDLTNKAMFSAYAPGYTLTSFWSRDRELLITLDTGCRVSGTVQDAAGMPVAGVAIRLNWQTVQGAPTSVPNVWCSRFTTVTDADGHWALDGLPREGQAYIIISDERYVREERRLTLHDGKASEPVKFTVRPGATVSGRIFTPNGTPVSGARVSLSDTQHNFESDQFETKDGSYRITGLAAGSYTLNAFSPSYAWIADNIENIVIKEGQQINVVDLHTRNGAVLEGDVVDADDGTPIPGIEIRLATGKTLNIMNFCGAITSDAQGHFAYHTTPISINALVSTPMHGYCKQRMAEAVTIELQDGKTSTVTIKLHKGLSLSGTVTDEQEKAAADVPLVLNMPVAQDGKWREDDTYITFTTDENGRFSVEGLPVGYGTIQLVRSGRGLPIPWTLDTPLPVTVPTTTPLAFTVKHVSLCTLNGRVLDTNQHPLAGVTATLEVYYTMQQFKQLMGVPMQMPQDGFMPMEKTVVTGTDGCYHLEGVPSGTRVVLKSLSKKGYSAQVVDFSRKAGEGAFDDVVMTACSATVRGVLRTPEGMPVSGAVVVSAEGGLNQRATSDNTGAFTLTGQPEGMLHLVAATTTGDGLATAAANTNGVTITCTTALVAKPYDVPLALSLLDADAKLPPDQRIFNRSDAIRALADVDLPLANKLAAAEPHLCDGLRAYLLGKLAATDPAQAEKVGTEQLDLIGDENCRFYAAVELGIAMVKRNPSIAEHCYEVAKAINDRIGKNGYLKITGLGTFDDFPVRLVSLAGLLQKTADLDAMIERLNARMKTDDNWGEMIAYPLLAAAGRVSGVGGVQVYNSIEYSAKAGAIPNAIRSMAQTDPASTRRLIEMLRPQTPLWGIASATRLVGKTDPAAALELAQMLPAGERSAALLGIAQYQPHEVALKILQDCFADERFITPEHLAYAFAVDADFAKMLYEKSRQKFTASYRVEQAVGEISPIDAYCSDRLHYAVAISSIDPVEARLIIESTYVQVVTKLPDPKISYLFGFAQACCSIDIQHALAICHDDQTPDGQYRNAFAGRVMQYILADQADRAVVDFSL